MPRPPRSVEGACEAAGAAAAAVWLALATAVHSVPPSRPTGISDGGKPVVHDRMAYKTVVEDWPGGSTWREYADGRIEYITVGGN